MSDISRKEVDAWPGIPSEPRERLRKVTDLYEADMSDINGRYLSLFLSALLSRFVSKPTVSSRIKRILSFVIKSRSGRNCSPMMTEGERNVLRSA